MLVESYQQGSLLRRDSYSSGKHVQITPERCEIKMTIVFAFILLLLLLTTSPPPISKLKNQFVILE